MKEFRKLDTFLIITFSLVSDVPCGYTHTAVPL